MYNTSLDSFITINKSLHRNLKRKKIYKTHRFCDGGSEQDETAPKERMSDGLS